MVYNFEWGRFVITFLKGREHMKGNHKLTIALTLVAALLLAQSVSAAVTLGNGGFEDGPASFWSWSSSEIGTSPIIDGPSPNTGTWYAYLGGGCGGCGEVTKISQTIKMPKNGLATLQFYLWTEVYEAAGGDKLVVKFSDDKVLKVLETDNTYWAGYTLVQIDLSAYTDGNSHTLVIKGTDKSGSSTGFNVDDVSIVFNAIENGGMEYDTDSNDVPDKWTIASPSGLTERVCDVANTGLCSVRLQSLGGVEQLIYIYKPAATGTVGDMFHFAGRFKGDNIPVGGWDFRIVAVRADGSTEVLYDAAAPVTGTYNWITGQTDVTVAGGDYKKIQIITEYTADSGTLWVDDFSMTATGGPVP
jgi:hypothetical protein